MNWNFQPDIHPDADQLSVFVEGAATSREQERMLAHLAECGECRKAVFLMQPHEEPQKVTAAPEKGWMRRWLVPVGLPAAALACGVIAVLIYVRPYRGIPGTPEQIASVRQPEVERPGTTAAPTPKSEQTPSTNSEQVGQSDRRQKSYSLKATPSDDSRQENPAASDLNLAGAKDKQTAGNVAPQATAAAPSASVQTTDSTLAQNVISSPTISNLPMQGRNYTDLQRLSTPAEAKDATSKTAGARNKELAALPIQGVSRQDETLAGVSGHITDRTGAVIAGAAVTVRDATGKTRQTTTSPDGSFHVTGLPAGQYELTATAAGFKTSEQSIDLKPSELAMLQPVLDIGMASEQVTVEAGAQTIQTETASLSKQGGAELPVVGRVSAVPSGLPVAETVSYDKRFLSLDSAGNLFLSRNPGTKWKKVNPQWTGKAVRIELTPAYSSEAPPAAKNEKGAAGKGVFQLTTDAGTVWTSKDGAHWHQQ